MAGASTIAGLAWKGEGRFVLEELADGPQLFRAEPVHSAGGHSMVAMSWGEVELEPEVSNWFLG